MTSALLQVLLWMSRLIFIKGSAARVFALFALSWTEQKQNSVPSFFREQSIDEVKGFHNLGCMQANIALSGNPEASGDPAAGVVFTRSADIAHGT